VTRRRVRVHPDLFLQLQEQLPREPDDSGAPTVAEFAASDLLDIVSSFEGLWDVLPTFIRGRQDYRELIVTTRLVPHVVVRGQISPRDGAIELVEIELDLIGLPGPGEHDQDDSDEI
jgi:hypothetical protein